MMLGEARARGQGQRKGGTQPGKRDWRHAARAKVSVEYCSFSIDFVCDLPCLFQSKLLFDRSNQVMEVDEHWLQNQVVE
jgi:hypothetical protein